MRQKLLIGFIVLDLTKQSISFCTTMDQQSAYLGYKRHWPVVLQKTRLNALLQTLTPLAASMSTEAFTTTINNQTEYRLTQTGALIGAEIAQKIAQEQEQ